MNIDALIGRILHITEAHRLGEGAYARYLWQRPDGKRKMGVNEYGCADAANILYTIGKFPGDAAEREGSIRVLQSMQDPVSGMYYEGTHHTIHTTAHCIAALELFDAKPLHPLAGLEQYLDKDELYRFLDGLDWGNNPWGHSHRGAGLYAAMAVAGTANLQWKRDYFGWLREHNDPETGLGVAGHPGKAPLCHQLYGWFHYLFNHEYAHMPIPNPERLIDSCIRLYREGGLTERFGQEVGFMEIDWVFAVNRASRQTAYRFEETKEVLWDFAQKYIPWLEARDDASDEEMNDLHMLFGAVCALSELQIALPGRIETDVPLKNVLDRRPFI